MGNIINHSLSDAHNGHTHRPLTGRFSLYTIYHLVQAAVSVVHNLEVVRYSGAAIALHILWRFQLMHVSVSIIRSVH